MMRIWQQAGTTMFSLLVGMVVSMLAILASLTIFHHLMRTSAEAKTDARHEGDLSLAVLRLDQELLAAGFNMDRAPGDGRNLDFVVLPPAVVGTDLISEIAWRFNDGAQIICRKATTRLSAGVFTLELFNALAGVCDPAAGALTPVIAQTNSNWVRTEQLVSLRLLQLDGNLPALAQPLIAFNPGADAPCSPFGAAAALAPGAVAVAHPVVRLDVFDVAAVYSGDPNNGPRPHSICLVNIVP